MGTRLTCGAIALSLVASAGAAQTGLRSASLPDRTPTSPPPTTLQGLRSASLPDRTPNAPVPLERTDQFMAGPRTYAQRFHRPFGRGRRLGTLPFGYGFGGSVYSPSQVEEELADGYLQLEVRPSTAQVHVDGYYLGAVEDIQRLIPGRSLEAGPHRLDLRAPGFEPLSVDIRVFPRETVTYRNDLRAIQAPTEPRPPAATGGAPKTFYVIPGCYAGDKPPRVGPLPRGCDASKVRRIPPVVSTVARR